MIEINMRSKLMYRIGGISLIIVGLSYLFGALLSLIIGPAPSGAVEYMDALAAHRLLSLTNFAFFTLADICLIPAAIALYHILKGTNKTAMMIASGLIMLFAVFDAVVTELTSFELVALTQNLAAATSEAQCSAIMVTANNLLSTLPPATLCSFVVSSVGLLITALVMLKGTSFSKRAALPGLTAGIAGTLGGFYIMLPALSLLIMPSLIAMGIWGIFAGRRVQKIN
jgi:hypothetical protein